MQQNTKLSPEQQAKFLAAIRGTADEQKVINQAALAGIIDPLPVIHHKTSVSAFKTKDPGTLDTLAQAVVLSRRDEPVLIAGESGTGKELIAQILHGERTGDFVAVNVCAVTDTLFESELFGHVRGAFTGADRPRDGLIKQADKGTLFLDEIGDMPLHLQAKMLRVIQSRTYRQVGGNVDYRMNCRVIAATHRDIPRMIAEKMFRLDLYQRLNVFELALKPIRERLDDIPLHVNEQLHKWLLVNMNPNTAKLTGNVRQLENIALRYEVFGEKGIREADLL